MRNPLERYLEIAVGLTGVTAQTAERFVQRLVKEGEVAADRAERMVADLLALSQRNRELVADMVRTEVERAMTRLSPTAPVDVDDLADRVVQRLRAEGMVLTAPAAREPDAPATPAAAARPKRATAGAKRTAAGTRTSAAAKRAAAAAKAADSPDAGGEQPEASPRSRRGGGRS